MHFKITSLICFNLDQSKILSSNNGLNLYSNLMPDPQGLVYFNSLPNDKILDLSKFKAFADDKVILTQKFKFVFGKVENIVGKGENAGY